MTSTKSLIAGVLAATVASTVVSADAPPPYITEKDSVQGFQDRMTASKNFKYEFILAQGQTVSRNPAQIEQIKSGHTALREAVYAPGTKTTGNDEDAYPQTAPEELTAVSGSFRVGLAQGGLNFIANPTQELSRGFIKSWGPVYHGSIIKLDVTPFFKTMEDCAASFKTAAQALKGRQDLVVTGECYGPKDVNQSYTATGGVVRLAPAR